MCIRISNNSIVINKYVINKTRKGQEVPADISQNITHRLRLKKVRGPCDNAT